MGSTVPSESIRVFLLIENRLLQADLNVQQVLDSNCDVLVVASFQTNCLPASITLECIGQLSLKVVLIGMDCDEEEFLAAVRAGVTGYLLKDASASDVLNAVRSVFRGEAVCPPQLCSTLFRFVAQTAKEMPARDSALRPELTLRQQQLVSLVAKGLTNKEIASLLNLSEFTVRNHIHRILKQVDAESRSEAVDVIRASGFVLNA